MAGFPQQTKRDVNAQFEKTFNGAYIEKVITLGSPICKQHYKRYFVFASRAIYFISVFAQILLKNDEEKQKLAMDVVRASFLKAIKETENDIQKCQAILLNAGIEQSAQFSQATTIHARVITPLSKLHLQLYQTTDELHRLIHTLWIEGEIKDEAKIKQEKDMKARLRAALVTAANNQRALINALRSHNKLDEASAAVGENIDSIESDSKEKERQAVADEQSVAPVASIPESDDAESAATASS